MNASPASRRRDAIAFTAIALVAAAHLVHVSALLPGWASRAWNSWFSDFAIPFALYLLWSARQRGAQPFADWRVRAGTLFGVAVACEVLQAFGVPALGRTFDPLDLAMYATGVGLALAIERRW